MFRKSLGAVALLLVTASGAFAANPHGFEQYATCKKSPLPNLIRTTVGIIVPLKGEERPNAYTNAIGATASFLDKQTLLTIEHVVLASHFSATEWRKITLIWNDEEKGAQSHSIDTEAKIANVFAGDPGAEVLVALALKDPVEGAQSIRIRYEPAQQNEPVVALAYPDQVLRFAMGNVRYPTPSPDASSDEQKDPPPYIPLDMGDKDNHRDVLNHGASSSPVFDCNGEVVAIVQSLKSRPMDMGAFGSIEVTPPWGYANNYAVPASVIPTPWTKTPANLTLPTHEEVVAGEGSKDDQLTALMNGVIAAAARMLDTHGASAPELQRAWQALEAFSQKEGASAQPAMLGLPQITTPFQ